MQWYWLVVYSVVCQILHEGQVLIVLWPIKAHNHQVSVYWNAWNKEGNEKHGKGGRVDDIFHSLNAIGHTRHGPGTRNNWQWTATDETFVFLTSLLLKHDELVLCIDTTRALIGHGWNPIGHNDSKSNRLPRSHLFFPCPRAIASLFTQQQAIRLELAWGRIRRVFHIRLVPL